MVIKPAILKGTRDFDANEIARRNYIKATLQTIFEQFGFNPIETPTMERLETLSGQYGEEGDRLIFKILNSGEKVKKANVVALSEGQFKKFTHSVSEKALRYDLTVPMARYVAQHQNDLPFPFRRYQIQPVWRADRPQHGRFQEFYQCDADIVGERSLWQEIEMVSLYDTAFKALGLDAVTLKINHRAILAALADYVGAKNQLADFTVALDKWDKIGKEGVQEELIDKGFSRQAIKTLFPLLEAKNTTKEKLNQLQTLFKKHQLDTIGLDELQFIFGQLEALNISVHLSFDLTLARGLHYYTGMIVEVIPPKSVQMGSLGGGGRYDDLTQIFGLKNMSGIGISFGFERIYLVMESLNLFPKSAHAQKPVLFLNFGAQATAKSFSLVNQLQQAGIAAELYPTSAKLKKQMLYAHKKQVEKVVLIGSDELEQKVFILKDMTTGKQTTHKIADLLTILRKGN